MDSLNKLLKQHRPQEPLEVSALKSYIKSEFDSSVTIMVQPTVIIITTDSSALASTLRLKTLDLQKVAGVNRKFIFRIG